MKLSILIATIDERVKSFNILYNELKKQKTDEVEILSLCDNKEMSIGTKRDKLYNMASGDYSMMVDDDDSLAPDYVDLVLKAIKEKPDCIGYKELVNFNGQDRISIFSLRFKEWENVRPVRDGIWYRRTPFCKTPIKTEICRKVGVKDMRFAEDHDFAKRVYPHLKTEVFIDKLMYYYNTKQMSAIEIQKRYGIK